MEKHKNCTCPNKPHIHVGENLSLCDWCKMVERSEKRGGGVGMLAPDNSKLKKWLESKKSGVIAIIGICTTIVALIDNVIRWFN